MVIKKEVCIIGGGVMGLSSAYYLSRAGKSAVVFERSGIGDGASAACDDMIMMQSKQLGSNLTLALDGLELFRSLGGQLQQDVGYHPCGGMVLIDSARQLSAMEAFVAKQRSYGLDVRIVEKKELRQLQPHVAGWVVASTYCGSDAHIDPLRLLRGFVKNARRLGADIIRPADVTGIDRSGDHWRVTTRQGDVAECDAVLLATGAWTAALGEMLGVHLPVRPRKGHILITEPIPPVSPTHLWSAAYIASKLGVDLVGGRDAFEQEIGHGFVFSRTAEGNHLIGGTRENAGFDKTTHTRVIETILRHAIRYLPILERVHIIRTIAGFRPATPDGRALVGPVPGLPGVFVLAGHEGDGISLCPLMGRAVADMICGRSVDGRFAEFAPERFAAPESTTAR